MSKQSLPLSGVRVIEFCEVAAGPFCGMLLADMGADVVKVERPVVGDSLRQWPPQHNGYSENFASLNRNKRSVVLDLKDTQDLEKARQLVATADVIVENYRPGVLEKNGLGFKVALGLNPKIVYCSISAFGQNGPRRLEGGFDLTLQAFSGIMSVTGEPDGPPVKCGVPIADFATGLYGAFAIASCIRNADRTGAGVHIDVPMLAASIGIAALQSSEFFGTGQNPRRLGSAHPRNAPYEAFRAKDGFFALAAGTEKLWKLLCEQLQRADLLGDPRFQSTSLRAEHQFKLKEKLEVTFIERTTQEWVEKLSKVGIPCTAINAYSEVLEDPQVVANNWVEEVRLPGGRQTRTFISPIMLDQTTLGVYRAPPGLGEHTEEVLKEVQSFHNASSRP